jgi:hypothetical protein
MNINVVIKHLNIRQGWGGGYTLSLFYTYSTFS